MAEKIEIKEVKKIEHANIFAALAAFQGELKTLAKTGKVSFKKKNSEEKVEYTYTPLGDIMEAIYPLLAKNGLSVRHELTEKGVEAIVTHETYIEVVTEISDTTSKLGTPRDDREVREQSVMKSSAFHTQNEIRSGIVKISQAGEMKDTGAAITYARRYSLTMVLGISSEEDKDTELLEQTAQNAMMNVMQMAAKKLENAKTEEDIKKVRDGFAKDLKQIEAGKAPALGLKKEQYDTLIGQADLRLKQIKEGGSVDDIKLIPEDGQ